MAEGDFRLSAQLLGHEADVCPIPPKHMVLFWL